jgi:hypothetical protein
MSESTDLQKLQAIISKSAAIVGEELEADVLFLNGEIREASYDRIYKICHNRRRRDNVLLLLTTYGGDAHSAYRIARTLQHHYNKFSVLIAGYCKSAGTLIVIGAHEIILNEEAQLGPLDVQLLVADETHARRSGLTPFQALQSLGSEATGFFFSCFWRLKNELHMTTHTASSVAMGMTTGIYGPIFAQLDPMRLGEMERSNQIGLEYAARLNRHGKNAKADTPVLLVAGYPDHGFVIDQHETKELFRRVREPSESEAFLVACLASVLRQPLNGGPESIVEFLTPELEEPNESSPEGSDAPQPQPPDDKAHPEASPPGVAEGSRGPDAAVDGDGPDEVEISEE